MEPKDRLDNKIRKPKNLHVHYLSYEDRTLLTRVVEAIERMVGKKNELLKVPEKSEAELEKKNVS